MTVLPSWCGSFTNCHDKSHLITFAGTTSHDAPAPGDRSLFYRMQPLLVALYTCQGVPMLWEGEEFVDDYQLPHRGAARVNLRRDVHWEYFYDDLGRPVIRLCRILGALRAANPALRGRQSYFYYEQSLVGNAIIADQDRGRREAGSAEHRSASHRDAAGCSQPGDSDARCRPITTCYNWLGREDSNLRMPESKSGALPLGYAPILQRASVDSRCQPRRTGE